MSTIQRNSNIRQRSGCFRCKEKHLRCTEEKPRCRQCEKANAECVRGLKLLFREDAAQRGISFGREGRWRRRRGEPLAPTQTDEGFQSVPLDCYSGRWIFLNTTSSDFISRNHHSDEGDDMGDITEDITSLSLRPLMSHPISFYPKIEGHLFNYFVQAIGPNCSLSASFNPYISLITPLSLAHRALWNALLAVAANQLRLLGDTRYNKEAYTFKHNALQGVQHAIATQNCDYGILATVLMLCFHDISDGCDPAWVTHLSGGLRLMDHISARSNDSDSLQAFIRMYFVAHGIMNRTVSDRRFDQNNALCWSVVDDLDEIDMVMGCSRRLMTLINRISDLAFEWQKIHHPSQPTPLETESYISATKEIELSLQTLSQSLPQHLGGHIELIKIAETKRLAALLYLHERRATMDIPGTLLSAPRREKPALVSSIMKLVSTLPNSATLLWPLFILGKAGLDNEEHRRFVLDRLDDMQKSRNLGSIRRAKMAVKRAFQSKDLDLPVCHEWSDDGFAFLSLA